MRAARIVCAFSLTACGGDASNVDAAVDVDIDATAPTRQWQTAESVGADATGDAVTPRLAVSDAGDALVVWRFQIANERVWARTLSPENGWGEPMEIQTSTGSGSDNHVDGNRDGDAVAVWGQGFGVWARTYTDGVWGTAVKIDADAAGCISLNVAVDLAGNAFAVWNQVDDGPIDVWANRYVRDIGWGTAELLETGEAGDTRLPAIAVDDDGNAIAVWADTDGTETRIWARRYAVGVGWESAERIQTSDVGNVISAEPKIAFDGSGNAVAVWTESNDGEDIWANHFVAGMGWGDARSIGRNGYSVQVATNAAGAAFAVYDGSTVRATRSSNGSSWGLPVDLASDNEGVAQPQIAISEAGDALAVWQGAGGLVWANQFVGGEWRTAEQIGVQGSHAQVAFDASGDAIAVWSQYNGATGFDEIWAARYR